MSKMHGVAMSIAQLMLLRFHHFISVLFQFRAVAFISHSDIRKLWLWRHQTPLSLER